MIVRVRQGHELASREPRTIRFHLPPAESGPDQSSAAYMLRLPAADAPKARLDWYVAAAFRRRELTLATDERASSRAFRRDVVARRLNARRRRAVATRHSRRA